MPASLPTPAPASAGPAARDLPVLTQGPRRQILQWMARLGAATPVQLAALATQTVPTQVPEATRRRVARWLVTMARTGYLEARTAASTVPALRHDRPLQVRVPRDRWDLLAHAPDDVRAFVARLAARGPGRLDRWTDADPVLRATLAGVQAPRNRRLRLATWVRAGWIETTDHRAARVTYYVATPAGLAALAAWSRLAHRARRAPVRSPRADQAVHHLLVISAALALVGAQPGARLLTIYGDEDLRSAQRKGVRFLAGHRAAALADGRVVWRLADQTRTSTDVEILISKYTDAKIREKYAELGTQHVQYYAPTARLCRRVAALGLPAPHLLT